jgi:EAL domain-containing protein (putative c-di-GMP-specific phosphodiesterase class I)
LSHSVDPDDEAIVKAATALGHGLKLTVTAEGVQTRHQANLLRSHGCDEVQGYFFGRPMPEEEFTHFMQTQL